MRGGNMNDFRFLKNQELIDKLQSLARLEKKTTAEIVEVIAEVDRRKLFLDLGHTSLFSYLTAELGYTPASAQRRIDAARMLSSVPEMKCDIESGALNLMQISVVSQSLRQKKKENPKASIGVREKRELLEQVKGLDLMKTQRLVCEALDLNVQVQERKSIQKDESLRVELTLSKCQQEKLQLAREILSHKHPSLSWAELFSVLAEEFIKLRDPRREPKRRDPRRDPRKSQNQKENPGELSQRLASIEIAAAERAEHDPSLASPTKLAAEPMNAKEKFEMMQTNESADAGSKMEVKQTQKLNSRMEAAANQIELGYKRKPIPLAVKREIHQRGQHCQWRDPITKRKCGSRFQLEVDHLRPVCKGGKNHKENLQILCDVHNRLKWRQQKLIRLDHTSKLHR